MMDRLVITNLLMEKLVIAQPLFLFFEMGPLNFEQITFIPLEL